ncbi:MAG: hypothetical protein IJW32_01940 [Clostridia bacterium]|nr:hypothetical protein [Clostridia bacterium]
MIHNLLGFFGLFDFIGKIGDIIITSLIAIAIVYVLILLLKNEATRQITLYALGTIIIFIGIASGFGLHYELTKESYINGSIDITNPYLQENVSYHTSNIVLYEDTENGNYVFDVDLPKTEDFNGKEKEYIVYFNDYILIDSEYNYGSVLSIFTMNFYDIDGNIACYSDITLSIKYFNTRTNISISVNDSAQAQYLEEYVSNNGLKIEVIEKL